MPPPAREALALRRGRVSEPKGTPPGHTRTPLCSHQPGHGVSSAGVLCGQLGRAEVPRASSSAWTGQRGPEGSS